MLKLIGIIIENFHWSREWSVFSKRDFHVALLKLYTLTAVCVYFSVANSNISLINDTHFYNIEFTTFNQRQRFIEFKLKMQKYGERAEKKEKTLKIQAKVLLMCVLGFNESDGTTGYFFLGYWVRVLCVRGLFIELKTIFKNHQNQTHSDVREISNADAIVTRDF